MTFMPFCTSRCKRARSGSFSCWTQRELVPSRVDSRWRSTAILGGRTDGFGGLGGARVGVSVERVDELGHLLVALDTAERSFGVEHAGGGPTQHHLPVTPA